MNDCIWLRGLSLASLFVLTSACSGGNDPAATATDDPAKQARAPIPGEAMLQAVRAATVTLDDDRVVAADTEPGNWLTHGRTYDEQRHSPLAEINADNVGELGLAWYWDTGTRRGLEATPIVVDGIMFSTGSWSVVWAHDAKTGELLWRYDPQVPREWGKYACCDVVNRGVAAWKGRI